jgi:ABC-type transport system involved in multi-copper enzyme maturation permease subunit
MTWQTIARRDWRVTAAARSVKVLLGLVVTAVVLAGYLYPVLGAEPITTARFSGFVQGIMTTLVPVVGVMLGYNAVVSDRESGAIRLSLSLPQSRRDLVLGTYASRTGLLTAALVAALALGGALVVYPFGDLVLAPFLVYVVLTVAFGAVWSGLGVAVSLAVSTGRRALVLGFALIFLFVVVWDTLEVALALGLNAAGIVEGPLPAPLQFLVGLEPGRVFARTTAGFVDPSRAVGDAWYLSEWLALALLAAWVVGPVALASARFAGSDLA